MVADAEMPSVAPGKEGAGPLQRPAVKQMLNAVFTPHLFS